MSSTFAAALAGIAIWLAHFRLPQRAAPPDLDPSWQQALSYALAHGIRFGKELVFTFGPLGGLPHGRYEPELYWKQVVLFEFLFKGLVAWRWVVALRRGSSALDAAALFFGIVFVALIDDCYFIATLAVIGAERIRAERPSKMLATLDWTLVAAISFIKFPYFVVAAALAAIAALRASARSRRAALGVVGAWLAATVILWTCIGQRPWDLPLWVLRTFSLARGYTESQATDGSEFEVVLALVSFALIGSLLVVWISSARHRRRELCLALVVAATTLMAFRSSFTSHAGPAVTYFSFLTVIPAVLVVAPEVRDWPRLALGSLRGALFFVAIAGFTRGFEPPTWSRLIVNGASQIEGTLRALPALRERRDGLEQALKVAQAEFDLPRTRAIVGRSTIDLVGCNISWILLNRFHWKPRPVLQTYSTSTRRLIDLDGEFFESSEAPEFALMHNGSIDNRVAWMDDNEALFTLMRGYRVVGIERGLVLLRRDPQRMARPRPRRETIATIEAKPGEAVRLKELPGKSLFVRFDIRYNWLGKLRRALYHAPVTTITLFASDGAARQRRIVPGMATSGILVRPLVEFEEDWTGAWTYGVGKDLRELRVGSSNDWSKWYEPTYTVYVDRCDELMPEPDPTLAIDILFGCFPTKPSVATGDWRPRYFSQDRREFVLVGPGARLVWDVEAGRRRLTGKMGVLQDTVENGDGVDFIGRLVAPDGTSTTLFERTLDKNAADALRAPIDVSFEAVAGSRVVLTTSNPPERDSEHDLPFLEGIEIR